MCMRETDEACQVEYLEFDGPKFYIKRDVGEDYEIKQLKFQVSLVNLVHKRRKAQVPELKEMTTQKHLFVSG